jgi:1-acyl-sn-glycerol-3-phosphate acyltransferase
VNHQATFYTYNPYLSVSLMVILARIYLRFYIEVRVGVSTFLPTLTLPKVPSDSDSGALVVAGHRGWQVNH